MTQIVLFHHVLGLTDGVLAAAARLRAAGHDVQAPDLFDGRVFADLDSGLAHVRDIGFDEILRRAEDAVSALPRDVVYGGLSLGVMAAQHLLQHRPGAVGGLFFHAFLDPQDAGGLWPDDVPVHVLAMEADPFFVADGDLEAARTWQAEHPNLTIRLYPGAGHLFMEPGTEDHDPDATDAAMQDALRLLASLPGGQA